MEEDEEEYEFVALEGADWSWPAFIAEFFAMTASWIQAGSEFVQAIALQFQRMHNKYVDDCAKRVDGEQFAQDILGGLQDL